MSTESTPNDKDEYGREVTAIFMDALAGVAKIAQEASDRMAALLEQDTPADVTVDAPSIRSAWGRKVLRLTGLGLEKGLTTKEISMQIGQNDDPNTATVLTTLEKQGLVEAVPGSSPKRWRLTIEQRRNRILRASRHIESGKWVTYGDIAVAIYGNKQMGRVVARVAAHNPAFANPHLVLTQGGHIAEGWHDDDGHGPEECKRRLEADGITVENMTADQSRHMHPDDLKAAIDADDNDF
jgi:alkylated DNA nucleotide flippase Atl1